MPESILLTYRAPGRLAIITMVRNNSAVASEFSRDTPARLEKATVIDISCKPYPLIEIGNNVTKYTRLNNPAMVIIDMSSPRLVSRR